MGKRWTLLLALTCFMGVLSTSFAYNLGQYGNEMAPIKTVNAQETNPDTTMTLIGKSGIVNDSVAEQSIITQNTVISDSSKQIRVWATAYSSEVSQTDSTPFITASGSKTQDGVAATNFLPFGTKFQIPELYGDKVFTVEDRMNAKYNNQKIVDIWMPATKDAIYFGKKVLTLQLL
jgi:3D (Asp-Asp-Asp) domain-containing protein